MQTESGEVMREVTSDNTLVGIYIHPDLDDKPIVQLILTDTYGRQGAANLTSDEARAIGNYLIIAAELLAGKSQA